jgi:hypothetical protein
MGSIVFLVAIYTLLVVFPFKLASGWFGADRTDWASCFVAVLIAGVLGGGAKGLLGGGLTWSFFGATSGILSLALVTAISGFTNQLILGTTFLRGVLITAVGALIIPGVFVAALSIGGWLRA